MNLLQDHVLSRRLETTISSIVSHMQSMNSINDWTELCVQNVMHLSLRNVSKYQSYPAVTTGVKCVYGFQDVNGNLFCF